MYALIYEKLTFFLPDTHTYVGVLGVRNVSFPENFAHLPNQ